jgi:hypothetical protein
MAKSIVAFIQRTGAVCWALLPAQFKMVTACVVTTVPALEASGSTEKENDYSSEAA